MRFSFSIAKYILKAICPYLVFSWLLLAVILFVQQGSRFSDIFFSASIPNTLVWQLGGALLPSIITFTAPMAALIGVIIGFFRLQGDGELVSIRATGIGNYQILIPSIFLGIILSLLTFLVNLYGVPIAAKKIKEIGIQSVLFELASPAEPGMFTTEVNGSTLYVKDGDVEQGIWKTIFIFNDKEENKLRLITAKTGRVDYQKENSELFLDDANLTTINYIKGKESIDVETVSQTRYWIRTRRSEIIENLSNNEISPEELGLKELADTLQLKTGREKTEYYIVLYRRVVLSITPLIFALLGSLIALRLNKFNKSLGVLLSLVIIVFYYLVALLGEQLARTNQVSAFTGSLFPVVISICLIIWFWIANKFTLKKPDFYSAKQEKLNISKNNNLTVFGFYNRLNYFLLDFDISVSLIKYFILAIVFLTSIFLIFTAFELWKFAGEIPNGISILLQYLFYLLPQIYLQFSPTALMVAAVITFVLKSRQNEVVTWTAAGRSVYRLLLPCFFIAVILGWVNWQLQEKVVPSSNIIQENLRTEIRRGNSNVNKTTKSWAVNEDSIYSFETNGNKFDFPQEVKNLTVYKFYGGEQKLSLVYKASSAIWEKEKIILSDDALNLSVNNGKTIACKIGEIKTEGQFNPFLQLNKKPGNISSEQIKQKLKYTTSESEKRNLLISLEKKYSTPFLPFVICVFTTPFALSLNKKGKVASVGYAIAVWLLFIGTTKIFEQFGLNGFINSEIATWSPIILFSISGLFFISRIKT